MPARRQLRLLLLGLAAVLSCVARASAQKLGSDPVVMAALLAQRDAITNWKDFSTANNISGWTPDVPYCQWDSETIKCTGGTITV